MTGEMAPSQPTSNELAPRANGVAVHEQPEIIDGEIVNNTDVAIRETGLLPYESNSEDIIDADIVEDEPLAITGSPQPVTSPTRIDVAFVDQSFDAKQAGRDESDRQLTEELNEGGRFKRLIKGIWKGNMAKDYYRLKYGRRAVEEIGQANNTLAFEADAVRGRQSQQATVDRFTSQYEGTVHTEAGERRETLDPQSELSLEIKQLIRHSIEQNLSEDAIAEERTRILTAYREANGDDLLGAGIVTADNLLSVRAATLGAIENGETLDDLIDNMRIMVGESRSGVRTEAHYNMVDQTIDKLNQTKIGSLVGPEVVATVTTLAASLLRFGSHKVISAAAMTIAPGIGGSLWAGLRENKRVKDERVQHSREMAQGKVFEAGDTRREQMEWTRYETASAVDLIQVLDDRFNDQVDLDSIDQFQAALDALSATQLRIQLSDRRDIDLISYSATASIEEERLALDIAMAQAKTTAEIHLDMNRLAMGVTPEASLQSIIDQRTEAYIDTVEGDISEKDQSFRRLKARRVAAAAATGLISGLTIGLVAQEGIAMLSDTRQGLIEQLWHAHNTPFQGEQHQTLLNGLFHGNQGQDVITHHAAEKTFNTSILGEHKGTFNVSGDQTLVENGDHSFNLVDPTGHATVEHLAVNPDGSLPQASLDSLHQHGMSVMDKSSPVDVIKQISKKFSVDQFTHNHGVKVTRDLWYANDTPAPNYDKNELGLHWGGHNGIGANGSYAFNVSTMTENGSFEGNQSADWVQQAHDGTLKIAISGSVNSQGNVIMVDIKPDGSVDMPAGSPAAHFFSNDNGQADFHGAYAEVVQTTGVDSKGVEHIRPLATLIGHNDAHSITEVVPTHTVQIHPEYTIVGNGYNTTEHIGTFTEMAPVIPIIPRRSMEEAFVKNERTRRYDGGNEYLSYRETEARAQETSPRLRDNPDASLNMAQETDFYKQALVKNRGKEYVADIDRIVANSKELNGIDSKLKTIVTIPVNAAGQSESSNIYNVLTKAYGQQDAETLKSTMILLHVNWFDTYDDDADVMRDNIARTKAEIERAKADCPQLTVATIETEWKRAEVQDGVIGHVARKLNDAALLALNAACSSGRIGSGQDVLLIRNDADPKGIATNYLKRFVDKFTANPEVDIFTGVTSFDNTKATRVPGLVFAANFMQSLDLLAAKREGAAHTGGANFGVRASVFAAVGAVGFDATDNIAGSDDVRVGQRIKAARSGRFSRNRKARSFYARRNSSYSPAAGGTTKRRVGMGVDARIDTDSDRGEQLYEQGIPIALQWSSFSENGYKPRDAGLDGQQKESLRNDPATVIERIRNDMEGSINVMGASPSVVETALTFAFLGVGKKGYELTRRGGSYSFKITPAGADYLENHLTRDVRGRFDSYGGRKLRQLYGQSSTTAKRQPNHRSLIRL